MKLQNNKQEKDKQIPIDERWGTDELNNFSICPSCKHYNYDGTCKAFPGGVPSGFLDGSLQHKKKIGDEQFVYEPASS